MHPSQLILIVLVQLATSISGKEEECTSKFGWRGTCRPSWECPALGELFTQGYTPELCGNRGDPITCCPLPSFYQPQNNINPFQSYQQVPVQPLPHANFLSPQGLHNLVPYQFGSLDSPQNNPKSPGIVNTVPRGSQYNKPPAMLSEAPRMPLRKRKRRPLIKTYVRDEDDNTIVRVTHVKPNLKRKKRKPLSTPFRALSKNSLDLTSLYKYPEEQLVLNEVLPPSLKELSRTLEKKCQEYSIYAWENYSETSPEDVSVLSISHEFCPGNVMDSSALISELPFMVGLGYEDKNGKIFWGCSGTLISEEYVLTAAHCLHPPLGRPKVVSLGNTHLDESKVEGLETGVSEVIFHPSYNPADRTANVALLRLTQPPSLSVRVRPACLKSNSTGHNFSPYWIKNIQANNGFGIWSDEPETPKNESMMLQKTLLLEVPNNRCNLSTDDDYFLCAEPLSTTCQSASEGGEPLIQTDKYNHCHNSIIGIAIDRVCAPFQPTIYTNIEPYLSWIEKIVWD